VSRSIMNATRWATSTANTSVLTDCGAPSATWPATFTVHCFPTESSARELLPVRSDRRSASCRQPCLRKRAVRIGREPKPGRGPDPSDRFRRSVQARPYAALRG